MADEQKKKVRWVKKDAFVMPALPASLKVDPVLAALLHLTAFLDLSGDDTVDPDWAVEAMEHVGHYLAQLSPEQAEGVREQVGRIADYARKKGWGDEAVEFFDDFLENVGGGKEDE